MARPFDQWSVSFTLFTAVTNLCILTSPPTAHADECGTRFVDPTSSTVRAQVVILGSVMDWNPSLGSDRSKSANVSIEKVYKGDDIVSAARPGDDMMVMVGQFGQEDKDNCVASDSEMSSEKHIFFLRRTHHRNMLQMSALPLAMVTQVEKRVKRSLCDTCVRPPHIKRLVCKDCAKEPTMKDMTAKKVVLGRRARLRCTAKGRPQPALTWSKNGLPVTSGNGGVTIRSTAKTSTLLILKTMSVHAGQYKCTATNDIGTTGKLVTLELTAASRQPKYSIDTAPDRVACESNLCSNGATCLYSPSLDLSICQCPRGYEGVRCENSRTINASSVALSGTTEDDSDSERGNIPSGNRQAQRINSTRQTEGVPSSASTGTQQHNVHEDDNNASDVRDSAGPITPRPGRDSAGPITPRPGRDSARPITPRPQSTNSVDVNPVQQPSTSLHQRPASFVPPMPQVQQPSTSIKQRPASFVPPRPQTSTSIKQRPSSFVPPRPPVQQPSTSVKQRPASFVPPRPQKPNGSSAGSTARRPTSSYGKYTNSRLKVSFCKEKDYCHNGGKCKYIPKQKFRFCQCRTGFVGKRCERAI